MQRRKFMQFAGATAFALATGATVVTIDGCSINITDAINIRAQLCGGYS